MTSGRLSLLVMPITFSLWTYYTSFYSTHLIGGILLLSIVAIQLLRESQGNEMIEVDDIRMNKKEDTSKKSKNNKDVTQKLLDEYDR